MVLSQREMIYLDQFQEHKSNISQGLVVISYPSSCFTATLISNNHFMSNMAVQVAKFSLR